MPLIKRTPAAFNDLGQSNEIFVQQLIKNHLSIPTQDPNNNNTNDITWDFIKQPPENPVYDTEALSSSLFAS